MKIRLSQHFQHNVLGESFSLGRIEVQWSANEAWENFGTLHIQTYGWDLIHMLLVLGARHAQIEVEECINTTKP